MRTFPPEDVEAFKAIARTWAATVTVVTARRRAGTVRPGVPLLDGFTATAFLTLSLSPPLLAVAVAKHSGADELIQEADVLVVNLLSETQEALSHAFARHFEDRTDAWERFGWRPDAEGVPVLEGTTGAFSARVVERMEMGDHLLVVGRVTAVHAGETSETLAYHRRAYRRLVPTGD